MVSRVDGICILTILVMCIQHHGLVVIGFWMMMGSGHLGCEEMEGIVGFTGKITLLLARENGGVIHGIPITTRVFREMQLADHIVSVIQSPVVIHLCVPLILIQTQVISFTLRTRLSKLATPVLQALVRE